MKNFLNAACLALSVSWVLGAAGPTTAQGTVDLQGSRQLIQGHAHNDYLHRRPLFDALDNGFSSIEVDVHLRDGKLFVAHDTVDIRPGQTLEALYLEPLVQRIEANGGEVYPSGEPIILLIDIKTDGPSTYLALSKVLERFGDILTVYDADGISEKSVNVVISGKRPRALMQQQAVRHAALDGRLADLDSDTGAEFIPLISDRWTSHFRWEGRGEMPSLERRKLAQIVKQAHDNGQKVRFWATPDTPGAARDLVWRALLDAGVDFINTDDLEGFRRFQLNRP